MTRIINDRLPEALPQGPYPTGMYHPNTAAASVRIRLQPRHERRWTHTQGVAQTARDLALNLPLDPYDKILLINAAWFHDVGYAENPITGLTLYGWHPLDGASLLSQWGDHRLANLIAWHTTALEESQLNGMHPLLTSLYPHPETSLIADALTHADMTTDPDGNPCTYEQRLIEIRSRHGVESTAVKAMENAWERLQAINERVTTELRP